MKNSFNFDYSIKKSKRKTVSIIIENDGRVRILAPLKYSEQNISKLLVEKQAWILEKLNFVTQNKIEKPTFEEGTEIQFLGRTLTIKHHQVNKKSDARVIEMQENLHIYMKEFIPDKIKDAIELWYREQAHRIIFARVAHYQNIIGKAPAKISVKTQHKRWGSCTSTGHILMNWRLILAPIEVIDYVVIHEMCHLHHMNHSKLFWNKVAEIDPGFKEKRKWFKTNGHIIRWPYEA